MFRPITRILLAPLAALLIALALVGVVSAQSGTGATPAGFCQRHPNAPKCHTSPTSAPTSATTATSPTSATTATSPTSATTATSAPPGNYSCTAQIGGSCGAYSYPLIPMSNGYDTYVSNQAINVASGGTETVHANSPGDWNVVANLPSCGGCVQTFPDAQQLTNDWGNGGWNGSSDTPLASLSTLKINYSETSPTSAFSQYEFAPDIWQDNYGSDVMFWVDTKGRCNTGAFGGTVLGHAVLDGQNWTVHRYGSAGAEIIFVLDGPGGTGTCAQQSSGTINIKAGLEWLVANGFESGPIVLSQINTGWEITQADNTTFTMHSYSITAQ